MAALYDKLRKPDTIWRAWYVVQENGRLSRSNRTRAEIAEFTRQAPKQINKIVGQLKRHSFTFEPATGVAIPKNSGGIRPLVLAPIPSRIVQRAALDIVQSIPEIARSIAEGRNYGGVEGVGVPKAVREAYLAAARNSYFIRSDIKSFFVKVPRDKALQKILQHVADDDFRDLLVRATTTELKNLAALGRDSEAFPLEDIGVAQGSALSPLLCNLLLENLDSLMNGRGIEFIRYIDDFILFAPTREKARKALASARRELAGLGLDCYDPSEQPDKADEGVTESSFKFLGCELNVDGVRPAEGSRKRLLQKIHEITEEALIATGNPARAQFEHHTYLETMIAIRNTVRGWGNTYAFCTDDRLMRDMDSQVSQRIKRFHERYKAKLARHEGVDKRRLLGIFPLVDCNHDDEIRAVILANAKIRRARLSSRRQETAPLVVTGAGVGEDAAPEVTHS